MADVPLKWQIVIFLCVDHMTLWQQTENVSIVKMQHMCTTSKLKILQNYNLQNNCDF